MKARELHRSLRVVDMSAFLSVDRVGLDALEICTESRNTSLELDPGPTCSCFNPEVGFLLVTESPELRALLNIGAAVEYIKKLQRRSLEGLRRGSLISRARHDFSIHDEACR